MVPLITLLSVYTKFGENILKLKTKVNIKQYPILWNYQTIFREFSLRTDNDL